MKNKEHEGQEPFIFPKVAKNWMEELGNELENQGRVVALRTKVQEGVLEAAEGRISSLEKFAIAVAGVGATTRDIFGRHRMKWGDESIFQRHSQLLFRFPSQKKEAVTLVEYSVGWGKEFKDDRDHNGMRIRFGRNNSISQVLIACNRGRMGGVSPYEMFGGYTPLTGFVETGSDTGGRVQVSEISLKDNFPSRLVVGASNATRSYSHSGYVYTEHFLKEERGTENTLASSEFLAIFENICQEIRLPSVVGFQEQE